VAVIFGSAGSQAAAWATGAGGRGLSVLCLSKLVDRDKSRSGLTADRGALMRSAAEHSLQSRPERRWRGLICSQEGSGCENSIFGKG
jgi:hypothetical protein